MLKSILSFELFIPYKVFALHPFGSAEQPGSIQCGLSMVNYKIIGWFGWQASKWAIQRQNLHFPIWKKSIYLLWRFSLSSFSSFFPRLLSLFFFQYRIGKTTRKIKKFFFPICEEFCKLFSHRKTNISRIRLRHWISVIASEWRWCRIDIRMRFIQSRQQHWKSRLKFDIIQIFVECTSMMISIQQNSASGIIDATEHRNCQRKLERI